MQTKTTKDLRPRNSQAGKRMKLRAAAEFLGMSMDSMKLLIVRGIFTCQQDVPDGDRYVLTDELEFWIEAIGTPEEREERLRDFRIKKRRIKK